MLSIERCRKLIEDDKQLSNEQVIEIRDSLNSLAHIAISAFMKQSQTGDSNVQDDDRDSKILESSLPKE